MIALQLSFGLPVPEIQKKSHQKSTMDAVRGWKPEERPPMGSPYLIAYR
jgi:hypothetical protein